MDQKDYSFLREVYGTKNLSQIQGAVTYFVAQLADRGEIQSEPKDVFDEHFRKVHNKALDLLVGFTEEEMKKFNTPTRKRFIEAVKFGEISFDFTMEVFGIPVSIEC